MKNFLLKDKNILVLIVINSFVIFLVGFDFPYPADLFLSIIDNVISAIFIVEVIVKLRDGGVKKYFAEGWNVFDFSLVAISLPSLLIFLFGLDLADMSYLLVFRTMRVFKVFRFFKFIPDIEKLIAGVQRALKASIFVLAVFVIYIFLVGMLSHSLFKHSELFSDPLTSIYSVIQVFTLEGWYELPEELVKEGGYINAFFVKVYFVIILLSGGVFGLSLVNSIFIDAMVSDNNDELEDKVDELKLMIKEVLKQNKERL